MMDIVFRYKRRLLTQSYQPKRLNIFLIRVKY